MKICKLFCWRGTKINRRWLIAGMTKMLMFSPKTRKVTSNDITDCVQEVGEIFWRQTTWEKLCVVLFIASGNPTINHLKPILSSNMLCTEIHKNLQSASALDMKRIMCCWKQQKSEENQQETCGEEVYVLHRRMFFFACWFMLHEVLLNLCFWMMSSLINRWWLASNRMD